MVNPSLNPNVGYHRPSINELFISSAKHCGEDTVSILLTGMGQDGAEGMVDLYHTGAQTIAQSPDSCVIDSMPQSAINMGVISDVFSPDEIIDFLQKTGKA